MLFLGVYSHVPLAVWFYMMILLAQRFGVMATRDVCRSIEIRVEVEGEDLDGKGL